MARKAEGLLLECLHPDHAGPRMLPQGWFARNGSSGRRHTHCRACRKAQKALDSARRRSRIGDSGYVSPAQIGWLWERQGGVCACGCGRWLTKYHVDHIRPLSKGGKHELKNLQLLTPGCNLKKGAKWK